jgi:hypothetical protein
MAKVIRNPKNAVERVVPADRAAPPLSTRLKDRSPAFPAIVIHFANGSNAYQLLKFDGDKAAEQYTKLRTEMIGIFRVIHTIEDLKDVPTPVLLAIFNRSRADSPLDRFRDRETAEKRAFEVIFNDGIATPHMERIMAEKSEATTSAEAKAQEAKEKREAKKAEKAQAAADAKAAREKRSAEGVIGTIKAQLEKAKGATVDEILAVLVEKFPDRQADGMKSTVKIQTSRLAKTTKRKIATAEIVGRGRVYKFDDAGEIPGKRVEAAAETEEAKPVAKKTGGKKTAKATAEAPATEAATEAEPATVGA